jgi:hypothetical protein
VRIPKDFKLNEFVSADFKEVMGVFCGSADDKGVRGKSVTETRNAKLEIRVGRAGWLGNEKRAKDPKWELLGAPPVFACSSRKLGASEWQMQGLDRTEKRSPSRKALWVKV